MQITLNGEDDTVKLGQNIAKYAREGDFFALYGDLGAGKTTFSRGFIGALAGVDDVPSPTFTILQTYDTDITEIYHYDLYRIETAEEIWELGWEENPYKITLVEWPERATTNLATQRLEIEIKFNAQTRIASIKIIGNEGFTEYWQSHLREIKNEFF